MMAITDAAAGGATVQLDVYSGRENPSWTLSAEQTAELLRRLGDLKPSADAPAPFDGLGYRSVAATAGGASVTLSRGGATMERDGKAERRLDAGRALERWLISTGRGHAAPQLIDRLEREILEAR